LSRNVANKSQINAA